MGIEIDDRMKVCNFNHIYENTIENNEYGIFIPSAFSSWSGGEINNNEIFRNNILFNKNAGLIIGKEGSAYPGYYQRRNNKIYQNNFIGNTKNAEDENQNLNYWSNGELQQGSYWSDYTEKYPNAEEQVDGVWNTPYTISGGSNQDYYPLIKPYHYSRPMTPNPPNGPTSGKTNAQQTYTASTTDPDGDALSYKFDWGDGTESGWTTPVESGTPASANHTWRLKGTYNIKVKAKDTGGLESDWSEPLPVTMPKTKNVLMLPWIIKLLARFSMLHLVLNQ